MSIPDEVRPDDTNPIADQNTERLLAGAYRPETPDPAFLARVTAAMHAAAAECVERNSFRSHEKKQSNGMNSVYEGPARGPADRQTLDRLGGGSGPALGLGAVAGMMFRGRPGFQQQDGTVWIDGKAYREADATPKDQQASEDRLKAGTTATVRSCTAMVGTVLRGMLVLKGWDLSL